MEKPKFKHKCPECKFLGHYKGKDLYVCIKGSHLTYIAREGDGLPDYISGEAFAKPVDEGGNEYLYEAKKRYSKKFFGLLLEKQEELVAAGESESKAFSDALFKLNPTWSMEITGTDIDPLNNEECIPEFLHYVCGKLYDS